MKIFAVWFQRRISIMPKTPRRRLALHNWPSIRGGLIALTAGGEGGLARLFADGQLDAVPPTIATQLQHLFPDRLYIELARRGDATEEAAEEALIALGL